MNITKPDFEQVASYDDATPAWVKEWNEAIRKIDEDGPFFPPMAYHGKALPYIGWYWRTVDFHLDCVTLGDCGDFVGFMENNKWGYDQWYVVGRERVRLLEHVYAFVSEPTTETSRALHEYLQTKPGAPTNAA